MNIMNYLQAQKLFYEFNIIDAFIYINDLK